MLIGFVLHHTGTVENPPVWGEEVQARIFCRELNKKGIDTVIINQTQSFSIEPDLAFYFSSDIPLKGGKKKFLWSQNDWDNKKLGENINIFDNTYDLILHSSPILQKLHNKGPLFRMQGDPEMYYPQELNNLFQLVDIVYVSNNIKPYYNENWIKPLAEHFGDRFVIYGFVWGGSGLERWWRGAPVGPVVPYIFANSKITLSLHLEQHVKYNVHTCRIPESLLAGKPVISDRVGEEIFNPYIWYGDSGKDLINQAEYILSNYTEAVNRTLKGRQFILDNHTTLHRINELLSYIKGIQ